MLPLLYGNEETWELADRLELSALFGRSGQASLTEIIDGLRIGSLGSSVEEGHEQRTNWLEETAAGIRTEIEYRSRHTKADYPFRLRGSSLERRGRSGGFSASTYAFCLMLSVIPWEERREAGYFPERIFEDISCEAAEVYLSGKSLRFGWPRKGNGIPSNFGQAVATLCRRIGEGDGYRDCDATGDEKDAGLDVVAWGPVDDRPGKIVLFGACATGKNWESKLHQLQPLSFCETYVRGRITPAPARAFFTPHVVPRRRWGLYTSNAGMLFDRCRLSRLVPRLPDNALHGDARRWMRLTIESLAD